MLKLAYFLRNLEISRANNSRILRTKNAKFSGYCFYVNTNIYWDFETCISVPLNILRNSWEIRKKIPTHLFSYKIWEIFKSIFFKKHLVMTYSGYEVFSNNFIHAFQKHLELIEKDFFFFLIIMLCLLFLPGSGKLWSQGMLLSLFIGGNRDFIDKVFMQPWTLKKLGTF